MTPLPGRARGAVLMITLIMLTMVTLLTTAAMRTARDQVVRAAGREFIDDADAAAEHGVALALRQSAFDTTRAVTLVAATTVNANRVSATVRYLGRTAAIPHSAWRAARHTGLAAYHFETIATARGPRRTEAIHRQQFFVVGLASAAPPAAITPAPAARLAGLPTGAVRTVWRTGAVTP